MREKASACWCSFEINDESLTCSLSFALQLTRSLEYSLTHSLARSFSGTPVREWLRTLNDLITEGRIR